MLLDEDEGKTAICIAKKAVFSKVAGINIECPPVTDIFKEKRGVFVTIREYGELRGCIGYPYPVLPLLEAISDAAVSAATKDPRFMAVTSKELEEIEFEVTVLTPPVRLTCPASKRDSHVIIGKHGLIIRGAGTSGLLLPQVATEYVWSPKEFLDYTCIKAGLPKGCWMEEKFEIMTFEGQIFN